MPAVLNADQRRHLDATVQRARTASEQAAADALRALAVADPSRPTYLNNADNVLRLALREKARQLGDDTARSGADLTNLTREVAYEQWHRLLFARFLEVNGLLRHPDFRDTSLTLNDCADLADDLGDSDGWSVAARFAAEILPGVFRLDDPAVQVRFATEHRLELEKILLSLPVEVLVTEDALGWVYQFWQTAEKKRVNASGVKIGGADLSPVTQLFTENYMVRFLLENSLGAWWAARHPGSPLLDDWEYLRFLDDGIPAAGTFAEWPATAAEVTVMDPCCGSGHFLVAMFGMLWRMRAEEEGLSAAEAQDAVLRENLHGLELDPRCTQIAIFNVALEAWKQGGFRDLPAPQIACSGVPARGTKQEWLAYAGIDGELGKVLGNLHSLFRHADTLGSLITPRPSDLDGALFGADLSVGSSWEVIRTTLNTILQREDQDGTVLGHAADDVVNAATLLAGTYTLVATNPPYLGRNQQSSTLQAYVGDRFGAGSSDLATAFVLRCLAAADKGGTAVLVTPENWCYLKTYRDLRRTILKDHHVDFISFLGPGAFRAISGEVVKAALLVVSRESNSNPSRLIDASTVPGIDEKADALAAGDFTSIPGTHWLDSADSVISRAVYAQGGLLERNAQGLQGMSTADNARFVRAHWEVPVLTDQWERAVTSPSDHLEYGGRSEIVFWEGGDGALAELPGAALRGQAAWGKRGIALSRSGNFKATLYRGELFLDSAAVILPEDPALVGPIWHYVKSNEFAENVRVLSTKIIVANATLVRVPFDRQRWAKVAEDAGPLPAPHSDDPTQWLFDGDVVSSDQPLQVALARLLGFRWPAQRPDDLDRFVDGDGIAALPSLPGEPNLATRLRELLAAAYGDEWSSALERNLVTEAGGKNGRLEDWLRDAFFSQHLKVFGSRALLWHIWDGRRDGFSAVVNYHRLDRKTLEKLTFTSLGAWIERQKHETAAGRAGADARLASAEVLQEKLKLILDGAPPYDVYVRWKGLHEQPIGWNPDLDDGVRLNIRPFVTAGALRSKVNVHWKKDRGTNGDGTARINDLHPTLEERREARRSAGVNA